MEGLETIIAKIHERLEKLEALSSKPKKKSLEKTDGSRVWDHYAAVYELKYRVPPVRNAMVNRQAALLATRVGVNDAITLVEFYLRQQDGFYCQKMHPLGLCLGDAETLVTRMRTGTRVTPQAAKAMDNADTNVEAGKRFLQKQFGEKK